MTLAFRPIEHADLPILSAWMTAPHVAAWWHRFAEFDEIPAKDEIFIVEEGGDPIGMVQRYRIDDYPEWAAAVAPVIALGPLAGMDYLIGLESHIGRGIGGEMISQFVDLTWRRYPDVLAIVVGVSQDNRRSWRALEKAGFTRAWAGTLESDDPSDDGPNYLYLRQREGQLGIAHNADPERGRG